MPRFCLVRRVASRCVALRCVAVNERHGTATYNSHYTATNFRGAWGEFSFILAQTAKDGELISTKTYNSIALTVLISIMINPLMLRYTLDVMADNAAELIETAKHDTEDTELGYMHPVYYCLQTRSKAGWGQQQVGVGGSAGVP